MYIYIGIEELVANALINLIENQGKRVVLFKELDDYGMRVIENLNNEGETNAILLVSRESQMAMLEDYSDIFEAFEDRQGAKGIKLRAGVEPFELWERFCTSLSTKVMLAFKNANVV